MSIVCQINEKDLIVLSRYTEAQLRRKLKGSTVHGILNVMRDLQIGLAAYSKKHKFDPVQLGLLGTVQHVERIAREKFFLKRQSEIVRLDPTHLTRPSFIQIVKEQVAQEWQALYRKYAY